jgi:hypothetical protein
MAISQTDAVLPTYIGKNDVLEGVAGVDLVFDVIGGDIGKLSAGFDASRRNTGIDRRSVRGAARQRAGG